MSDIKPEDKIYKLLGELGPTSPTKGLSDTDGNETKQALTNTYITTMYFSALSNLYLQNLLPESVDDLLPRFKIAYERSYADFTTAKNWLNKNGSGLIESSPAKAYYDEVYKMGVDLIKDLPTAFSSK